MTKRHTPPGRMSNALVVLVKPSGPHHCARCLGSVHASNTSSRGASSTRVVMMARGSRSRSMLLLADTLLLRFVLRLQLAKIILQAVETFFPEAAIALQPIVNAFQSLGFDAARAPLRLASARDQAGALQHLEVLGDRRAADVEGLGQLVHRGLAERQPRQDRPARRVGEGCEFGAQRVHGIFRYL